MTQTQQLNNLEIQSAFRYLANRADAASSLALTEAHDAKNVWRRTTHAYEQANATAKQAWADADVITRITQELKTTQELNPNPEAVAWAETAALWALETAHKAQADVDALLEEVIQAGKRAEEANHAAEAVDKVKWAANNFVMWLAAEALKSKMTNEKSQDQKNNP